MKVKDVDKIKPEELVIFIKRLITKLDELDGDDFFGTEGWSIFLGED